MIINQIYNIGKAFFTDEEPVEILLKLQNPPRKEKDEDSPALLEVEADISDIEDISYKYALIDYNVSQESKYLLGLSPGNSTNYSLSLSLNWKKNKKTSFKKLVGISNQKVGKISVFEKLKEIFKNDESEKDLIDKIEKLIEDIEKREKEISDQINDYLLSQGKKNFQNSLFFKIKDNDTTYYLGEIPSMRKMYEYIFFPELDKESKNSTCQFCDSNLGIQMGFHPGTFTIDQKAFKLEFFRGKSKFSTQFNMCYDCYLKTILGYSILSNRLNFYAYSIQEGRDNVSIYHYIIPTTRNLKKLRKDVELIYKTKKSYDDQRIKTLSNQIKSINRRLEEIKESEKSTAAKLYEKATANKKENLENKMEKLKSGESNEFKLEDLIMQLYSEEREMSIMDIYYKITEQKQTPKSKEIINQIIISNKNMKTLGELFKATNKRFNLISEDLKLWALKFLMRKREFLHYYSSLFSLNKVSRKDFHKYASETLKRKFLNDLYESGEKEDRYYRSALKTYEFYNYIFSEANLWSDI